MIGKEVQNTGGTTPVVFIGKKTVLWEKENSVTEKPYLWTAGKLRLWRGL